ncbi:hypothetical protein HHI36_003107 [Cryptolaemus montrouzieri]|uniref:Uncharacterized protein n=1 Tax=Cryptolaemus montrouzieri TaxID=559131 RepID=A0ABD2PCK7_9CUCU
MFHVCNKPNKTNMAKRKKRVIKKSKKTGRRVSKDTQMEEAESVQFLDYHIKYLCGENNEDFLNGSDLFKIPTLDKSTACYFREFGDFWPYLERLKKSELIKDKRFCFMLNHPQYLRRENRLYLEKLQQRFEAKQEKSIETKEMELYNAKDSEQEKIDKFELDFKLGENMMKKNFPNYFLYLKSYYMKKKLHSLGNKDNAEFKQAIVKSSKQSRKYLDEMEKIFEMYLNNFVTPLHY